MIKNSEYTGKSLFFEILIHFKRSFLLGTLSLAFCDILDISPPLLIKTAIDAIEKDGDFRTLSILCAVYVVFSLLQGFFRFLWRKFFIGTSHKAACLLRKRLYEHIQTLSFGFFNKMKTGELMSRLTNDIDEARMMFGMGMLLMMDALFYFLSVPFIMLALSPKLAVCILVPLPVIPFFIIKFGRLIHKKSGYVQECLADLSAKAQENISGIRIIKSFVREKSEIYLFAEQSGKYLNASLDLAKIEAFFHPSLEFAWGFGIFSLLFFGGKEVINGGISIGTFVAFQALLLKMVWPMTAIGMMVNIFQRGLASLNRCSEILNWKPEISPECVTDGSARTEIPDTNKNAQLLNICGDIEVNNLSFRYETSTKNVIENVSFKLNSGTSLGITGPIGSGKTTLIMLLLRIFQAPEKTIFLDGKEIEKYSPAELRNAVSYVPQETFLFSESIKENIAFGIDFSKSDSTNEKIIKDSAHMAHISDEIESLPSSYETLLGERGVNLSGGQKQRLSLARAFAKQSQILIVDDAISAVDAETEAKILSDFFKAASGRTVIIVSHRIAAIQKTDSIIFLQDGKIAESGSHDQLVAMNGQYAKLWNKQLLKSELDREEV
ncbi:MAG: ABC transporter ATP-binding protein [Candidatus Riflebacteria bacterium]|nr:ABC transporter ATP-binding protein [Candidatus Riflebacteria bacterium]